MLHAHGPSGNEFENFQDEPEAPLPEDDELFDWPFGVGDRERAYQDIAPDASEDDDTDDNDEEL
jgi:hypothetical protein